MKSLFVLALALLPALAFAAPFEPRELLSNGGFEAGDKAPAEWRLASGITWEQENGNRFLRLRIAKPGSNLSSSRTVRLEPEWGVLRVSCRVRYEGIIQGSEGWHTGRLAMSFKNDKGERVGEWPNVLNWLGSSPDWKQESRDYVIPEGATTLALDLAIFSAPAGRLEFDDVKVAVAKPRPTLEDAPAPAGADVRPWQVRTGTRAALSLNGYWRFRPLGLGDDAPALTPAMLTTPPARPKSPGWGWIPVPSCWPGQNREAHTPVAPDIWALRVKWNTVEAAWYEREVAIPADWAGRRVFVSFDMPQTQVALFVDGQPSGTVRWPAGRVDITDRVRPGATAKLAAFVTALPFSPEKMIAMREDMVFQAKSEVRFRGLCGDVLLESEPAGAHIAGVQLRPSVRGKRLGVHLRLAEAPAGARYTVAVEALWQGKAEAAWVSPALQPVEGALAVEMPWLARRLWDLDQPNLYTLRVRLRAAGADRVLDEVQERLGFREVWVQGRQVLLNGTPVHWRALNFSNHTSNAGAASYAHCRETLRRMRSLGFNFAILSNYGFDPGETMAFADLLRAADDEGFLLSFSTPHPLRSLAGWDGKRGMSDEWKALADYCVLQAQNHPSVLAYAMSHNVLGYGADQNPAKMDGKVPPRPSNEKAAKDFLAKREVAAAADAYVRQADPTRTVYHHQSGNMGDWHTVNIYLCWAPIQERMEWLSHWATEGVKPLFFVEWGLPHVASWGSHRLGPFIWRNKVNSEPWAVEFGAEINGDAAYRLTPDEEKHIDRYERVYARGQDFHITEVLGDYWSSSREHNMVEIQSEFTRHIWPAFRTWGITAVLPWDQGNMARSRPGSEPRKPVAWKPEDLASPGIHPDFLSNGGDYFQCGDASARELSSLGETFRRVNADVLAYIAGKPGRFTEQGHLFRPGERLVKQLMIINDRRAPLAGKYAWTLSLAGKTLFQGKGDIAAPAGGKQAVPITVALPAAASGGGTLSIVATPTGGRPLQDTFAFTVVPAPAPPAGAVPLLDPRGDTAATLKRLGVGALLLPSDLSGRTDRSDGLGGTKGRPLLVVGRRALSAEGPAPDIAARLAKGGTVLVLEQDEAVLTKRLGFRVNTPSLRRVFARVPGHPALAGLSSELLRDWRGEATLIPTRFSLPEWEEGYPMVEWLGFTNSRAWKWGNGGQVASVAIEKPQGGDFLSLLDGGFDLQYSPLLEARVGAGRMIFCQMDVTARTEADPAADRLLVNLIRYAQTAPAPAPARPVRLLAGDPTRRLLAGMGVVSAEAGAVPAGPGDVVVADEGGDPAVLRAAAERGARVVVLAGQTDGLKTLFGPTATVDVRPLTHTPPPLAESPAWRGVGPAEVHLRGRTQVATVTPAAGAGMAVSTGMLAEVKVGQGSVVHCGVSPLVFDYAAPNKPYLKLTHKRTATLVARILANQGAAFTSPLADLWARPVVPNLRLAEGWRGFADTKEALTPEAVSAPDFDDRAWPPVQVPGVFDTQRPEWEKHDGVFWYRVVFQATPEMAAAAQRLHLGPVDDEEWTYLNGQLLGHIGQDNRPQDYWSAPRDYALPAGALRPGANVLVVKVRDLRQSGGITRGPVEFRVPSRWLSSYYLDAPAGMDDPYRYNRW